MRNKKNIRMRVGSTHKKQKIGIPVDGPQEIYTKPHDCHDVARRQASTLNQIHIPNLVDEMNKKFGTYLPFWTNLMAKYIKGNEKPVVNIAPVDFFLNTFCERSTKLTKL